MISVHTPPSGIAFGTGYLQYLIHLFNYFDWIGYLTDKNECNAIDREVLRRKLGSCIINYYKMCEDEIRKVQEHQADRWPYPGPLCRDLIARREERAQTGLQGISVPRSNNRDDFDAFLQREHVRSHRGFHSPKVDELRICIEQG